MRPSIKYIKFAFIEPKVSGIHDALVQPYLTFVRVYRKKTRLSLIEIIVDFLTEGVGYDFKFECESKSLFEINEESDFNINDAYDFPLQQ